MRYAAAAIVLSLASLSAVNAGGSVVWNFTVTYYDWHNSVSGGGVGVIQSTVASASGRDTDVGMVSGFDLKSGADLWNRTDGSSPGFGSPSSRSGLVASPTDVYYSTSNENDNFTRVFRVDIVNGSVVREHRLNVTNGLAMAFTHGRLSAASSSAAMILNHATLEVEYTGVFPSGVWAGVVGNPVRLDDGGFAVTTPNAIMAFVPPAEKPVWTYLHPNLGGRYTHADPHGTRVINSIAPEQAPFIVGHYFSLNATTGDLLWQRPFDFGLFTVDVAMVTTKAVVLVGSSNAGTINFIAALDVATGSFLYNRTYSEVTYLSCSGSRGSALSAAPILYCLASFTGSSTLHLCPVPTSSGRIDASTCTLMPATFCGAPMYQLTSINFVGDDFAVVATVSGPNEVKERVIGVKL